MKIEGKDAFSDWWLHRVDEVGALGSQSIMSEWKEKVVSPSIGELIDVYKGFLIDYVNCKTGLNGKRDISKSGERVSGY